MDNTVTLCSTKDETESTIMENNRYKTDNWLRMTVLTLNIQETRCMIFKQENNPTVQLNIETKVVRITITNTCLGNIINSGMKASSKLKVN